MSYLRLAVAIGLCLLAAGCTELDPIVRGSCGNGIVEPEFNEDCDGPTDALCGAADDPVLACRRLCDFSAAPACADGAACGQDGACHQASGAFSATSARPWSATDTLVIDSNGDGALDLVGVSNQRVDLALGIGDGSFASTTTFPGQYVTGAPAVGDPTGDGLPDVLVPTPLGVVTMAGDAFDGLVPVTQNTLPVEERGRMVLGAGPIGSDGGLIVAARGASGVSELTLSKDMQVPVRLAFPPGLTVDNLVSDELAILAVGAESVLIAAFASGVWMVELNEAPTTPGGFTMVSLGMVGLAGDGGGVEKAFFTDTNADDYQDLVVITSGPVHRIQVLRGAPVTGLQTFPGFVGTQATAIWSALAPGPTEPPAIGPLALRPAISMDVDHDDDVLTPDVEIHYIVVAAKRSVQLLACLPGPPAPCAMFELRRNVRAWTHAAVIDVNGDLYPDLVGHATGEANVDVLLASDLGLGFFLYNEAVMTTPGGVRGVVFGELDGDGVRDIVAVVGSADGDELPTDHELHIAFGTRGGAPAPAALAAKVGAVVATITVNLPFVFRVDGIDDLVLLSERAAHGDTPSRGFAILFGSTSRRLVAPLVLSDEVYVTPVALAPMHLDERAGEDLVVLARTVDTFEILTFSPDGFTMAPLGRTTLPIDDMVRPDRALWTTVARSGPFRIGAAADDQGHVIALEFPCSPCGSGPPVRRVLTASVPLSPTSALRAADYDGDGDDDLLGVFSDGGQGQVVLWNHDGGMAPAAAHVFTIDGEVHDAIATDLDLDGVREIVFAAERGILIARRAGDGWEAPVELHPRADGAPPFVFIEALDLTGDGLPDLAVATGAERKHPVALQVLAQIEARSAFGEVTP